VCCCQACARKRHYQLNKEATLATNQAWREKNRERANAIDAACRARWSPERIAEARRLRNANKKAWRKANPQLAREEGRCMTQARRAREKGLSGKVTVAEMAERLGLFGGCCAYCGAEGRQTMDHFIPMAAGGKHEASNLLPACLSCNCRKNETDAFAWFQEQDFFSEQRWQEILGHTLQPAPPARLPQ
jgi:5-methylcytosine-specific restriction endonuclease McrA